MACRVIAGSEDRSAAKTEDHKERRENGFVYRRRRWSHAVNCRRSAVSKIRRSRRSAEGGAGQSWVGAVNNLVLCLVTTTCQEEANGEDRSP